MIRIVTWNIHGCVGADGKFDVARTIGVLRHLQADVIALQEVDSRSHPVADTFAHLQGGLGAHALHATAMTNEHGAYGQMLISRWRLQHTAVHDISVQTREPRKVLEARIGLPGGPVRFLATHLGLNRTERRHQLNALRGLAQRDKHQPTVLLGDFNDWRLDGASHVTFAELFDDVTRHRTFPARLPLLPLDRIWCRPGRLMQRSWAVTTDRHASDHLPVAAELDLPGR